MSTIATVFDIMRGRRKQAAVDQATGYLSLVRAVATGDEIDAENAADILEIHGKSEADFARDCETQARRFADVDEYARLLKIQDGIPALQAEVDRTRQALDAAVAKYQPTLFAAADRLRLAEQELLRLSGTGDQLRRTVLDGSIATREAELSELRTAIHAKLRPILEDLDRARSWERSKQTSEANLKHRIGDLSPGDLPSRSSYREKLDSIQQELRSVRKRIADLESLAAEYRAEMLPIDRELSELDAKKLEA